MKDSIPSRIENCPIIDAIVEIRFRADVHPNAVFGILFARLRSGFSNFESLPILQLPEPILKVDRTLQFKPHYKATKGNLTIQIGPNVFVVGYTNPYPGWHVFADEVKKNLETVFASLPVSEVTRIGVRFVNFFELDIFKYIDPKVVFNKKEMPLSNALIRTELQGEVFTNTLNVNNNSILNSKKGSIIDIDTFLDKTFPPNLNDILASIEQGHHDEKNLFFSLLTEEFLHSLKPIYQ